VTVKLYRYVDGGKGDGYKPQLWTFETVRETPTGRWLQFFNVAGWTRWMRRDAANPYAHPSREEALAAYIKRKDRHLAFISARREAVHANRAVAQEMALRLAAYDLPDVPMPVVLAGESVERLRMHLYGPSTHFSEAARVELTRRGEAIDAPPPARA